MKSLIKTECGIKKYEILKNGEGYLKRLRFYWFVIFAVLKDLPKKKNN